MESGRLAEPLPLVEPEALRDPPERGRDPPDESGGLLHPPSGLLQRRTLSQPSRMLRQLGYSHAALLGRPLEEGLPAAVHLSIVHENELVAPPFHDSGVPLTHLVDEAPHLRRQIGFSPKRLHAAHDPGVALHPGKFGTLGFGPRHEGLRSPYHAEFRERPASTLRCGTCVEMTASPSVGRSTTSTGLRGSW